jgi:hypothetical protein
MKTIIFDDWNLDINLDINNDESHDIIFILDGREVYRVWLNDVVDVFIDEFYNKNIKLKRV